MPVKFCIVFCCVIIALSSKAQLCRGSLGDPVVDITFGAGTNPGPPLSTTTTNISYFGADCPEDGNYTIINSTNSCFQDAWFTLASDHTGDANGYFMLVNASYTPSDFYLDTVHGLCPNTTFEFAAWILNMLRTSACSGNGIQPNITFKIENTSGAVIANFNTGNIPSSQVAQWVQYGFFFQTPPNITDVVVRMTNNAAGGCGNDLALDDITFRPCGPTINASISGANSTTVSVCEGQTLTYTFNGTISSGYDKPSFQWQENNGSGWTDIANANTTSLTQQFSAAGNYQYRLAVADSGNIGIANCRIASNVLSININAKPVPDAVSSIPACFGKSIILSASGGAQYQWTGPDNYSSTNADDTIANASAINAGKYYVTVTSTQGCTNTDSVTIAVNPNPVAFAGKDSTICAGQIFYLDGSGGVKYLWQPATTLSNDSIANPLATPVDTTQYSLVVTNQFGCTDTSSVIINVVQPPVVSAGPNKIISQGQFVQLNGTAAGTAISFYWLPDIFMSDPDILQPVVNPPHDTTYTIYGISKVGCAEDSSSVFVRVYQKIIVPNAFSPNNDGINDRWNITALNTYPNSEVSVFNRYGQIVFHSINYTPWNGTFNGKPLPVGTYYYIIDLKNNTKQQSGWVEILR